MGKSACSLRCTVQELVVKRLCYGGSWSVRRNGVTNELWTDFNMVLRRKERSNVYLSRACANELI